MTPEDYTKVQLRVCFGCSGSAPGLACKNEEWCFATWHRGQKACIRFIKAYAAGVRRVIANLAPGKIRDECVRAARAAEIMAEDLETQMEPMGAKEE